MKNFHKSSNSAHPYLKITEDLSIIIETKICTKHGLQTLISSQILKAPNLNIDEIYK